MTRKKKIGFIVKNIMIERYEIIELKQPKTIEYESVFSVRMKTGNLFKRLWFNFLNCGVFFKNRNDAVKFMEELK